MKLQDWINLVVSTFLEIPYNNISSNIFADNTEPIFSVTSQMPSKTRERSTSINPIPELATVFAPPDGQS